MIKRLSFFILMFLIFTFCGNQANSHEREKVPGTRKSISPEVLEKGEEVYKKYCLACHQSDGSGNPGMFPPLSETKTVNGDKETLINIILNGMQGKIIVKGEVYNQVMVPHSFLSDKEIAAVLTYIRNSFGNNSGAITEDEVGKLRPEY